jgi:hypothetical protein
MNAVPEEVRTDDLIDARRLLTPEERAKMLARIHSLVYWVGMLVPERELLAGSEIDLREVVFKLTNKDVLTPEEQAQVHELIRLLREKERSLEKRLARDPMTVETAQSLLEEICGLLKAMDELRTVESPERAELRKSELLNRLEDARRWKKFAESIRPPA